MSMAEEGGAVANTSTTSYGGGGAGGKHRNKNIRRRTTPYDRPPTSLRVNNTNSDNNNSWLPKKVIEHASKLISYGAGRLLPSVFRRRLPLPPPPPSQPPQPPEMEVAQASDEDQGEGLNVSLYCTRASDEDQGEGLNIQGGEQEPRSGQCSQPVNNSRSNGVAELEHLFMQKTFTRSEIAHLTELLHSQATEASPGDASQKNVVPALDAGRQKEFASCVRNDGSRPSAVMNTPIQNSKVLESDVASPAELAKAYMGSRLSQVSPSGLRMRNELGKEHTGLFANMLIASKSPTFSLAKKTSASLGAAENGFITPRTRSRSAIYNMARTPYSRVQPSSTLKGSGVNGSDYAGPSTSSSSLSTLENDGNFVSGSVTLKRRSSVLDDEVGSVGPMRRIRQKPNLLTPKHHHTAYGVGIDSRAKPKPQLNGEEAIKVLKNSGENDNESLPSTSYAHVPSKSREVAAKILQQLEKFSPREKSSESKMAAMQDKSPSKSVPSGLPGQALQSTDDVGSSKLSVPTDHKSGNKTNGTVLDGHGSSLQNKGKAVENDPHISDITSGRWSPLLNNDSAVSLIGASVVKNGTSQPQKKRAFSIGAKEDTLPAEEFKNTQSEDPSFSGLVSRSAGEHSPGASTFGQGTNFIAIPASEGTIVPIFGQGTNVVASSISVFDKPKEGNNPHLFSHSSKAADKPPLLSTEAIRRAESEPEPERPSSLASISTSIGSEVRTPESHTGFHFKPVNAVDTNGKCDDVSSAALNGPGSLPAASSSDINQISTGSAPLFSSSTITTNITPAGSSSSTAAPFSGSIFGLAVKSSSLDGSVSKPVFSADLSSSASVAPSERADQIAQVEVNPSSGSSTSLYSAGSGNGIFKFGSLCNSTGNSSLFATAAKPPVSGVGTISQDTTIVSVSSASVPALNMHSSGSLGSLPTPSISSGFSSTPSSDTTSVVPAGRPVSSPFKFGATPTAGSEGSSLSSITSATSSAFKFGFSSSPSTNTVGSSSGPATPTFNFGGSTVSASGTNTVGSSSGPAAPIFSFGASSVSASGNNTVGSSSGPAAPIFSFGASSVPASGITNTNTASSFSSGASGVFGFGGSSSASFASNSLGSSSAPSNAFGSGWQNPKSSIFGSMSTSASPPPGFSFSASTNAEAPMAFNSSKGPVFSFTSVSASALSSPSLPTTQPIFGTPPTGGAFAASPRNTDQMNADDSMAEDPVPPSASNSVFGRPSVSPSPPSFMFGSANPSQSNPFVFSGQQNEAPLQNPSPFQASGSLEFNAGGSFSLGSAGGDKAGRKIVKVSRSKNRKK